MFDINRYLKETHGNAKNGDIKRLNIMINNILSTPEAHFIIASITLTHCGVKIYKAIKEEKRKDLIESKEGDVVYEIR